MLGRHYRLYRPAYSTFAAASLGALLYYQYSIDSPALVVVPLWIKFLAVPLGMAGLVFMWKSIRKYFFYLSGVDVLLKQTAVVKLETSGLHRLVRHPLYFGTLAVIWAAFTWFPSYANAIACIVITGYTLVGIRFEEDKLVAEFGEQYRAYQKEVSMLMPGVYLKRRIKI